MHRLAATIIALSLAACFDSDVLPDDVADGDSSETGSAEDLDAQPGPLDLPAGAGSLWHACDAGDCAPGLKCYAPAAGYDICVPIVGQWVADPADCDATHAPPLGTGDTFVQPMGDLCVPVCTVYPGPPTHCDAEGSILCVKGECGWAQ